MTRTLTASSTRFAILSAILFTVLVSSAGPVTAGDAVAHPVRSIVPYPAPSALHPVDGLNSVVPYPPACSVTPCDALNGVVVAPDRPSPTPASIVTVDVRSYDNLPIPACWVLFEFGSNAITGCPGAVFQGTANAQGRLELPLPAGGCIPNADRACTIRANGVPIRIYRNVKSPDFDGSGGNGTVDLRDVIELERELAAHGGGCHDYDNDGHITLADVIIMASAFSHHCP